MKTDPKITDPDAFFEKLIAAQEGLDDAAQETFLHQLILLLANQVGETDVLIDCIDEARAALTET